MILGLRCWPEKFAFVLIDGTVSSCHTVKSGVKKFPTDLSRPGFLNWISKELKGLLTNHNVKTAVYKQQEFSPQANRGTIARRAEVEGVIQAVLYENGCQDINGLLKQQVKKMTGYSGSAADILEVLSTTPLKDHIGEETEEAALVAFAVLKEQSED
jgi:Holliday junction resolvasome RuvABC endonuclease subunit